MVFSQHPQSALLQFVQLQELQFPALQELQVQVHFEASIVFGFLKFKKQNPRKQNTAKK